jgi:hypothetical protein
MTEFKRLSEHDRYGYEAIAGSSLADFEAWVIASDAARGAELARTRQARHSQRQRAGFRRSLRVPLLRHWRGWCQ